VDHLHVLGLFLATLGGGLLWILAIVPTLLLGPWLRARNRRLLGAAPEAADPVPAADGSAWAGRTAFVLAGEPSGDRIAAPVVRALGALAPDLALRGYAGPACAAAGVGLDRDLTPHAVVGVLPVVRTLPFWWRLAAEFHAVLRTSPPDLLLTVDFPGLNRRLARWASKRGVRTVHLVAPAVWAHSTVRVLSWRAAVQRVLALFPHEPPLLAGLGLQSVYVGHPLFEAPLAPPRTPERWPGGGACWVELLPGSRRSEIRGHAALMLEAAADVERSLPRASFVVRLAREEDRAIFDACAAGARARPTRFEVSVGERALDAPLLGAIASSGTVTAELAAAQVPLAVVYHLSAFGRLAAWTLLTAPWISLANLVAGRAAVSERLQTLPGGGARLARDFLAVAADAGTWERARAELGRVRRRLETPDVALRTAHAVLLGGPPR
jgi:lipid-A-disaccharide synthase